MIPAMMAEDADRAQTMNVIFAPYPCMGDDAGSPI